MLRVDVGARVGALAVEAQLAAPAGGCLALAGPSGAGKTSLLRIVAGLLRPARGRVAWGDETWVDAERGVWLAPEARGCGCVFQDYALFPHLPAWRNVAYGMRHVPRGERRQAAVELLDRFGMAHAAAARPRDLSGGERQRVALARALAQRPRTLLLDEPLAALDPRTRGRAARELASAIRESGAPAILVSHDFADAALVADRVAVLDGGRIVQEGTPAEVVAAPASAFVADFTGAVLLLGTASPGPDGLTVVALDGGGVLHSPAPARGPVAATVFPWEVALEPAGAPATGSALNRLEARVESVTVLGSRARVALAVPQPLAAEVARPSVERLGLAPGARVDAVWKASATRLVPR